MISELLGEITQDGSRHCGAIRRPAPDERAGIAKLSFESCFVRSLPNATGSVTLSPPQDALNLMRGARRSLPAAFRNRCGPIGTPTVMRVVSVMASATEP